MSEKLFITLNLCEKLFGVEISLCHEILSNIELTLVEHTDNWVKGIINLRGQIVTILDPAVLLSLENKKQTATISCIILNALLFKNGGGIDESEIVGLAVDSVGDVCSVNGDRILNPPANLAGINRKFLSGVVTSENELIMLLNVSEILHYSSALDK